jgi:lipid A 3-O-deacylase
MTRLFFLAAVAATQIGHSITTQASRVEFAVGQTGESTMT